MQKWIVKADVRKKKGFGQEYHRYEVRWKLAYDLDIWRIRNPEKRKFTWRQKKPFIQRRFDYWLTSDWLQDFIEETDIIPSSNLTTLPSLIHVQYTDIMRL